MKIRSITAFIDPSRKPSGQKLGPVAGAVVRAKEAFEAAGIEVQTTRLATTPFVEWVQPLTENGAVEAAVQLEALAADHGFAYVSMGPALPELPESYSFIPEMLAATKNVFLTGVIATMQEGISMAALRASAAIICKASTLEDNGFANLRFAALANVPPGSPFFPAAYAVGGQPAFALATESADLAVEAFDTARSVPEGSRRLTESIQQHAEAITDVAEKMAAETGITFGGIDFSLAPFPEEQHSLGTAFERMGVPSVGQQGSLAAAAILTQAIDAASFPRVGFNGLLLPPLEDATLAKRAAGGTLTVNDLLMYSAVCGTGLDTVPLAGDTRTEDIEALLLDLAALALRLDKPLTARLMPIPGKAVGETTQFDFDFFANSQVMALKAAPLRAPFADSKTIEIKPRKSK